LSCCLQTLLQPGRVCGLNIDPEAADALQTLGNRLILISVGRGKR